MSDATLSELRDSQIAFAAHIRDPQNKPPPDDIEDRRMAIYRELFFNNVGSFLAGYFPITRAIIGDDRWQQLMRDFYREHYSQTPLFTELAAELLDYLANERTDDGSLPGFITELAHYEWVEGAINLAPDPEPDAELEDGDLLTDVPEVSPVAWLLSYQWPVHEISKTNQPSEPLEQPLHFLVYRGAADDVVFNTLNPVSARLLQLLGDPDTRVTGRAALETIAAEMGHQEPEQVVQAGAKILQDWRTKHIILGTKPAS